MRHDAFNAAVFEPAPQTFDVASRQKSELLVRVFATMVHPEVVKAQTSQSRFAGSYAHVGSMFVRHDNRTLLYMLLKTRVDLVWVPVLNVEHQWNACGSVHHAEHPPVSRMFRPCHASRSRHFGLIYLYHAAQFHVWFDLSLEIVSQC